MPFSANSRNTGGTSNFGISNFGMSNFGISNAGAVTATGFGLDFVAEEAAVSGMRIVLWLAEGVIPHGPHNPRQIGPILCKPQRTYVLMCRDLRVQRIYTRF